MGVFSRQPPSGTPYLPPTMASLSRPSRPSPYGDVAFALFARFVDFTEDEGGVMSKARPSLLSDLCL